MTQVYPSRNRHTQPRLPCLPEKRWLGLFLERYHPEKTSRNGDISSAKTETIASLPGFGMVPEGHLSYSFGPNIRTGRTKPCSVRVHIDPIPPKELRRLPTCHRQRSSLTVAPTSGKPVRVARTRLTEINSSSGGCTTSGISTCGVRVIWWSPIRSTTVRSVASTLTRTSPIWHHPAVSTPTA